MKTWILLFVFIFNFPTTVFVFAKDRFSKSSLAQEALVYIGPGSCDDFCSQAAAKIAENAGLIPHFVSPEMIKPEIFQKAALYIQPGGNAIKAARALGPTKLRLIRQFVKNGGGYLGFCAGAFLTDKTVDAKGNVEGLGLIPWETDYYYPIDSGENGTLAPIKWGGKMRNLYFNGGGTFKIPMPYPNNLDILATYEDGSVASLHTTFGDGHVAITGAHPEALDQWKKDAGVFEQDIDGPDLDLAFELLCWSYPNENISGCPRHLLNRKRHE